MSSFGFKNLTDKKISSVSLSDNIKSDVSSKVINSGPFFINQKDSNTVEASTQVNLPSPDLLLKNRQLGSSSLIICYDSDDEMLKQRQSRSSKNYKIRKNKRIGVYSKEDIRDQYCINQKELQAFEEFSKNRLFGCLSTGNLLNLNFSSNFNEKPYVLSSNNKKENNRNTLARYADISDSETSSDYGCKNTLSFLSCMRRNNLSLSSSKQHYEERKNRNKNKINQQQSDDDFGFKKPIRPPRTCTIKPQTNKICNSISVLMADNQSLKNLQQPFFSHQNPQLANFFNLERQDNFKNVLPSTSKSADDLNEPENDSNLNGNKTKHVSFDIVRSNTISSNLAQQVYSKQIPTIEYNQLTKLSSNVKPNILNSSIQTSLPQSFSYQNQMNAYIPMVNPNFNLNTNVIQTTNQNVFLNEQQAILNNNQLNNFLIQQPILPPQPPLRSIHKKISMKTQSTQTDNNFYFSNQIPKMSQSKSSRSLGKSRFKENYMLEDDQVALYLKNLEPSDYESSLAESSTRRTSIELPDYLTLSPRTKLKHKSKKNRHLISKDSKKNLNKQLLINYQKIQNQYDESDNNLDELSLLSKLSQLDYEQRNLSNQSSNLIESSHKNKTKKISQDHFIELKPRKSKNKKNFENLEPNKLFIDKDLSKHICSVRNEIKDNYSSNKNFNNSIEEFSIEEKESKIINEISSLNKFELLEQLEFEKDEKLCINLSPPEAFQDKIISDEIKEDISLMNKNDNNSIQLEESKSSSIMELDKINDNNLNELKNENNSSFANEENEEIIFIENKIENINEKRDYNFEKNLENTEIIKEKDDKSLEQNEIVKVGNKENLVNSEMMEEENNESLKSNKIVILEDDKNFVYDEEKKFNNNNNPNDIELIFNEVNELKVINTDNENLNKQETYSEETLKSLEYHVETNLDEINFENEKKIENPGINSNDSISDNEEELEDTNLIKIVGGIYLKNNQSSDLSTVSEVSEEATKSNLTNSKKSSTKIKNEITTEKSIENKDFEEDNLSKASSDFNEDNSSKTISECNEQTSNFSSISSNGVVEDYVVEEITNDEVDKEEKSVSITNESENLINLNSSAALPVQPDVFTDNFDLKAKNTNKDNVSNKKKCISSDNFDPIIYRTFSCSIEEQFDKSTGNESIDENEKFNTDLNFSKIFCQSISIDKEPSLKENLVNGNEETSIENTHIKNDSCLVSSINESTSSSISETNSKSKCINNYALLSSNTYDSIIDNCSQCAAQKLGELVYSDKVSKNKENLQNKYENNSLENNENKGNSLDVLAPVNLETAGESSQATEKDVAGFSFTQQSSQDLADEDSLCLVQSINAAGNTSLNSITDKNTTKNKYIPSNTNTIKKRPSSLILEKERQLEISYNSVNLKTDIKDVDKLDKIDNMINEKLSESDVKKFSQNDSNKENRSFSEKLSFFEKECDSQESTSNSESKLKVRNLMKRFESRPLSFAGECSDFNKILSKSQNNQKIDFANKNLGNKSQSADLIVEDYLEDKKNSKKNYSEDKSQNNTCETESSYLKLLSNSNKTDVVDLSFKKETENNNLKNKIENFINEKSIGSTEVLQVDDNDEITNSSEAQHNKILFEKQSEKQKDSSEEIEVKLISAEKLDSVDKSTNSPYSSETTKTFKLTLNSTNLNENSNITCLDNSDYTKEFSPESSKVDKKTEEFEDSNKSFTTLTSKTELTTELMTDYSELRIKQHDQALRQKQQFLQQQQSIKRKLLTQLSTSKIQISNLQNSTAHDSENLKTSSSQDDVLEINEKKYHATGNELTNKKVFKNVKKEESDNIDFNNESQKKIVLQNLDNKKNEKNYLKEQSNLNEIQLISQSDAFPIKLMKKTSEALRLDEIDEDIGIHSSPYTSGNWFFITYEDEIKIWGHKLEPQKNNKNLKSSISEDESLLKNSNDKILTEENNCLTLDNEKNDENSLTSFSQKTTTNDFYVLNDQQFCLDDDETFNFYNEQSISIADSEKSFCKHFQTITHRMIHRKASLELYKRKMNCTLAIEKNVTIEKANGEFGFRIHGSKPVVVSAVERGTEAERCGLEIGDVIVTINDVNVLEFTHSDVVRLAHSGCLSLRLGLLNTSKVIKRILSTTLSQCTTTTDQIHSALTSLNTVKSSQFTSTCSDCDNSNKNLICSLEDEDQTTFSNRSLTSCSSLLTSCLDFNSSGKVFLTGYLLKAKAFEEDFKNINEEKWRLRFFKLRLDGTLHWFSKTNNQIDPLGIISLKSTYCKLINISDDDLKKCDKYEEKFVFCLCKNKTNKVLYFFKCHKLESAQKWINSMNFLSKQVLSTNLYIERTLRYTQSSPMYIKNPDCVGYLGKKSNKTGLYIQRYFILKDGCLYFYFEIASNITLGLFYLQGYKVQSIQDGNQKYCIQLVPSNPQHKFLSLCTDSEIDKKRWFSAFEYSIDRWLKLN